MTPTVMLLLLGALLLAGGLTLSLVLRKRTGKTMTSAPQADQPRTRAIVLAFDEDDLRATRETAEEQRELDPDEADPFLASLRNSVKETVAYEDLRNSVVEPELQLAAPVASATLVMEQPLRFSREETPFSNIGATPIQMPIAMQSDPDDGPIDFSGFGAIDSEERRRLLQDLETKLSIDAHDAPVRIEEDEYPRESATLEKLEDVPLLPTFKWTTFMGNDAQSLGEPERAILVKMLRNLHEPAWCMPTLLEAFHEEQPDGLRPMVLEALIHSYHGEHLSDTYTYCLEYGSDEEQKLARAAIETLEVVGNSARDIPQQ